MLENLMNDLDVIRQLKEVVEDSNTTQRSEVDEHVRDLCLDPNIVLYGRPPSHTN